MPDKLTRKQKLFCHEYCKDQNGKQAAIRAGYSERTATSQAARLLTKGHVTSHIDVILERNAVVADITNERILEALWDNHLEAKRDGQLHNSNRSLELCGKAGRMFIDRVETTLTVYEEMSESELDHAITQAQQDIERIQTTH